MSILERLNRSNSRSCFASRIEYLHQKGYDTALYVKPIEQLEERFARGVRSLVVYGEPQSGKTEFMIALVCKLIDIGYKTIFLILNDNTELELQNYKRFKDAQQIKPSPINHIEFINLEDYDKRSDKVRIIFCRKNKSNLEKLITHARYLKNRVVVDDEADYASPDTKINQDGDPSVINRLVGELGCLGRDETGRYIGVTATPGRLDLNNTFFNQSSEWIFLDPHKNYKGRSFFFPTTTQEGEKSDFILFKMPAEHDNPKFLKEAFLRYLVRCAILNLQGDPSSYKAYSMLIHTDGTVAAHEEDRKQILKHIHVLSNGDDPKIESYLKYMQDFAEKELWRVKSSISVDVVLNFVLDEISRNSVLILNNKNLKQNVDMACNPVDTFTIAIGGNIVSRGLTFNNLLSFFFSRGVRNRMQQNTYIQRARMFGNRPYHTFFELCVPEQLLEQWATCFVDHELSLQFARKGEYVHIFSDGNTPSDNAAIDKSSIVQARDEWLFGSVFPLSREVEDILSQPTGLPIDLLEDLIASGKIPQSALPAFVLQFIRDYSSDRQGDISIVTATSGGFVDIENYADADVENITRKRGGFVSATINNRPEFSNKLHLIVAAKNRNGFGRFYYKHQLGKRAIKNLRS